MRYLAMLRWRAWARTAGQAADAGADTFVAGSAIFGQADYRTVIDRMRSALR